MFDWPMRINTCTGAAVTALKQNRAAAIAYSMLGDVDEIIE